MPWGRPGSGRGTHTMNNRIVWLLLIVLIVILAWLILDHVLFPTLPMPAGAPAITK